VSDAAKLRKSSESRRRRETESAPRIIFFISAAPAASAWVWERGMKEREGRVRGEKRAGGVRTVVLRQRVTDVEWAGIR